MRKENCLRKLNTKKAKTEDEENRELGTCGIHSCVCVSHFQQLENSFHFVIL